MTEQDKLDALLALFEDYLIAKDKPLTSGRLDVLYAKVSHLMATPHEPGSVRLPNSRP